MLVPTRPARRLPSASSRPAYGAIIVTLGATATAKTRRDDIVVGLSLLRSPWMDSCCNGVASTLSGWLPPTSPDELTVQTIAKRQAPGGAGDFAFERDKSIYYWAHGKSQSRTNSENRGFCTLIKRIGNRS